MAPGMVPNPAEVADRMAIHDILAMHSRGLDRLDSAALTACYWPDATVDYGSYKGPAHAFIPLVIDALRAQYALTRHGLGNILITFAHDSAQSETCVSAGHLLPDAEQEIHFYGRYLDHLVKRDQCWKIQHRQVVMDWSKRHVVVDERDSEAFAALSKGAHLEKDPLYTFGHNAGS
ncbi:MAG: nuclear transport factor 2 family protein [Gammaproteobacteria bacterium]|nr:nuclear transport factor 2 family protein [Gammaproteobacteria bacterium]